MRSVRAGVVTGPAGSILNWVRLAGSPALPVSFIRDPANFLLLAPLSFSCRPRISSSPPSPAILIPLPPYVAIVSLWTLLSFLISSSQLTQLGSSLLFSPTFCRTVDTGGTFVRFKAAMDMKALQLKLGLFDQVKVVRKAQEFLRLCRVHFDSSRLGVVSFHLSPMFN